MKILKNRRLLIIITIVALVLVGLRFRQKSNVSDSNNSSKYTLQNNETIFVQAAKQFAMIIPDKWSVTETSSGKQTLIYPTGSKINSADAQTLINQDVIIVETATNKKDSFESLINEIKTNIEKNGSAVTVTAKDYGTLKGSLLTVSGKTAYQQLYFNTPTIIIITAKNDLTLFDSLAKSLTTDLSVYADDMAQAANLIKQTNQNIASGKYPDIYKDTTDALKKLKNEEEFANLLKGVTTEFNKNIMIWGIFINNKSLGAAINITDQDKIIRRASFYYVKEGDRYLLDSLRVSGQLTNTPTEPAPSETTPTETSPAAPEKKN